MTMEANLPEGRRVAGARQVLRAVRGGQALLVLIAGDADAPLKEQIAAAAKAHDVPVQWADTMQTLGRLCKVYVPSAAGAILREGNQ